MFGTVLRILAGAILAYLAAGLTKILFAFPPAVLQNMSPDDTWAVLGFVPGAATHMALFTLPLALATVAVGEWRRWRDWAYYAASSIIMSMIGFFSWFANESATQGWSITSTNYPLVTFLTTGFVGGLVYWLVSGRHAGGPHAPQVQPVRTGGTTTTTTTTTTKSTGSGNKPAASGQRR